MASFEFSDTTAAKMLNSGPGTYYRAPGRNHDVVTAFLGRIPDR
jgi:hypothetical protein